jgi:O-antigen/teichoic acid export membrane protein
LISQKSESTFASGNELATLPRWTTQGMWVVGARGLSILTALAINALLARMLTPADFGHFFIFSSILTCASLGAMFGLNTVLIRAVTERVCLQQLSEARLALRNGFRIAAVTIVLGGALSAAILYFFGYTLFGFTDLTAIALLMLASVLILAILQLIACCLRAFHESRMSILLAGQLGGAACNIPFFAILLVFAAFSTPSLISVLKLNAIAMFAVVPVAAIYVYRIARSHLAASQLLPSRSRNSLAPVSLVAMLWLCLPLAASQLLSFVLGHGDLWVAGVVVPPYDLALYGAARRLTLIVGIPMQMAQLTVVSSIAVLYARASSEEMERKLRSATTLAAVPATLLLLPLILMPGVVATVLFGPFYQEATTVIVIMGLAQIVFVWVGPADLTLIYTGRQHVALVIHLITAAALLVIMPICASRYGIVGLAVANGVILGLQNIAFCVLVRRLVGVSTLVDVRLVREVPRIFTSLRRLITMPGRAPQEVLEPMK